MSEPKLVRLLLWVADVQMLSDWYCKTFGWKELVNEAADGWIELDAGGFILALHGKATVQPRHWPKIQIAVGDVATYREKMIASGIAMGDIAEWKHLQWCECVDPEGNTVQISNR